MLIRSFRFATRGITTAVKSGRNLRIMIVCLIVAVAASFILGLSGIEWTIVLLCCAGVISLEMVNTSIESVINAITAQFLPLAKNAKDIAAGAVLVFSVLSAIIGLIIFIPHIIQLIKQ